MKKLLWILIGIAVILLIVWNNIQTQETNLDGKRKVYAALPLTGVLSVAGQDYKKAMELAISKIDNPQIDIVYLDTEFKNDKSISVVQQAIINDPNPLVFSFASLTSNVLIPYMANQNKGFIMAGETIDLPFLEQYNHYQRISVLSNDSTKLVVDYAIKNFHNKVGTIYSNDPYGTYMATYFMDEMKKAKVPAFWTSFDNNSTDIRNTVTKILSQNKDLEAIFVAGTATPAYINIIRELKNQGFKGTIFASLGFAQSYVFENLGNLAENVIFMTMEPHLSHPRTEKAQKFRQECLERNMYPSFSSVEGYDMTNIINYMASHNIPFTQEEFLKLKEYDGVTGKILFNRLGNATYQFILAKLVNGEIIPVESETK